MVSGLRCAAARSALIRARETFLGLLNPLLTLEKNKSRYSLSRLSHTQHSTHAEGVQIQSAQHGNGDTRELTYAHMPVTRHGGHPHLCALRVPSVVCGAHGAHNTYPAPRAASRTPQLSSHLISHFRAACTHARTPRLRIHGPDDDPTLHAETIPRREAARARVRETRPELRHVQERKHAIQVYK